ncbi:MAG: winged helix-turn-helix domain-containing protein [Nitrosotalea sp.]
MNRFLLVKIISNHTNITSTYCYIILLCNIFTQVPYIKHTARQRSKQEIIFEILQRITISGTTKLKIKYMVYLSHQTLEYYLDYLLKSQMLSYNMESSTYHIKRKKVSFYIFIKKQVNYLNVQYTNKFRPI